MKFAIDNKYLAAVHLPSYAAARNLKRDLGIGGGKVIVTNFGVDDISDEMASYPFGEKCEYVFSIGRSNRDFDFLVRAWSQPCLKDELLIIAADQWKPSLPLPPNVIHMDNLHGKESLAYLYHAKATVIPIDDGEVASGDTVLLHSMSFSRPIIITSPSTLAEMYVDDGKTGVVLLKDEESFAAEVKRLLDDNERRAALGKAARENFLSCYSQYALGVNMGARIKEMFHFQ